MTFKFNKLFLIKLGLFLILFIEITSVPKDFSISIYGNVLGFGILFLTLFTNFQYSIFSIFFSFFLFFFYYFVNLEFYFNSVDPYKAIYYCLIAIFLSVEFRKKNFSIILEDIFFKYLIFIVIVFFLGFGIDDAGGTNRIQGFMSEPSALSLILNFLFWSYYSQKNYKKLIFIIFVCILTFSLVVYVQIILFYILRLIFDRKLISILKLSIILIAVPITLYLSRNIENDFWLIHKAVSAVNHTISGGSEGKNSRSVDLSTLIQDQSRNSLSFWIGNGPNYGVYYYSNKEVQSPTQNLPSILFFNFGIIGLIIGLFWIFYSLNKLRKSTYYLLLLSAVSYSLINTASGIVNDIYVFTLLFYSTNNLFTLKGSQTFKVNDPNKKNEIQ